MRPAARVQHEEVVALLACHLTVGFDQCGENIDLLLFETNVHLTRIARSPDASSTLKHGRPSARYLPMVSAGASARRSA